MDGDDIEPGHPRPLSASKMSKVPSWISVGFVLGALVGWTVRAPKQQPPPAIKYVEVPVLQPRPNKIATVEGLFEKWKHLAGWRDDTAEILIWNTDTNAFSEAYEVRRVGDDFYFRSIPQLTRKLSPYPLDKLPSDAPIRFAGVEDRGRSASGK